MEMLLSKRKIGASDAPVIMGVSPWTTRYELWMQKVSGIGREDNPAMQHGREMEPVAREAYEKHTGIAMPSANNLQHPVHDFMTVNLDGLNFECTRAIEIKNPCEKDHTIAANGKIPEHYFPQCQHQLAILCALYGIKEMDYVSYCKGDLQIVPVEFQDSYISTLIQEEQAFWDLVLSKKAPAETAKDYQLRDDEEWSLAMDLWRPKYEEKQRLKKEYEEAEAREKEMHEQLIALAGDRLRIKGCGVRFTRSFMPGAVQYKNIPELKSVDLEAYRKPGYIKTVIVPIKEKKEEDEDDVA